MGCIKFSVVHVAQNLLGIVKGQSWRVSSSGTDRQKQDRQPAKMIKKMLHNLQRNYKQEEAQGELEWLGPTKLFDVFF
jgi:hypothetical protein